MESYFEYLRILIITFFQDMGTFFRKAFADPWADVPGNFQNYNFILSQHSGEFGFVGWLFWVIFLVFFVSLIGAILFGIFLLLRKYIRFVRRELQTDELRRRREDAAVEIRKQKREENLAKRRNFLNQDFSDDSDDDFEFETPYAAEVNIFYLSI